MKSADDRYGANASSGTTASASTSAGRRTRHARHATAAAAMPAQPDGPFVLVATKALPVGTIVDANSFRFQPWPKELIETAYFIKEKTNLAKLSGSVVRNAITAGQPVTIGSLIQPGERGFLAAALGPGMRAVTVPVNAQSSVAGFIFPGDRVDLSGIDANTGAGGDQAFPLVNNGQLTAAGQLAVTYETRADGEFTILQGNVDGDTAADFKIQIEGHHTMNNSNVTV